MTRHYSTKDFFRQMPNALLARYFAMQGLFRELDFAGMKEGNPEPLFQLWLELPDTARTTIEADLRDVFGLSDAKGFIAILDEAKWHLDDDATMLKTVVDELSALPSHHERAMVTFLDYRSWWKGATRFHHADRLPYWRKRKNLPNVAAAVDDASVATLAQRIRDYFHHTEGRGKNCVVEPFRRGARDYFFAYPEDHSQRSIEWVEGVFEPRPHNPAFEIVFVYSQSDGTLDLNFRGPSKVAEALQGMFVTTILKLDEIPPDPEDTRVYDLNLLDNKDFQFIPAPGSGIEKVSVKKLRLTSRINAGDRITLEADTSKEPAAVYTLLEQIKISAAISLYNVTQVELTVTMAVTDGKKPKHATIRITHPNSCSLKYEEIDLKLRDMLANSGIEPKEPVADGTPATA